MIQSDGPKVMTVDAKQTIRTRSVKLGRDLGDKVEILSGLNPAEPWWRTRAAHCTRELKSKFNLSLPSPDEQTTNHEHKRTHCRNRGVEGNRRRHRQTYETTQSYRSRRAFPDATLTARGARNKQFSRVEEWRRGRSKLYPLTKSLKNTNTKEIQIMKTKFYWVALLASAA